MTMEMILGFIIEGGLIMIPTLWFVGLIIRNTKKIENHYIPFILIVLSIGLTPLLIGGYNAENIVQAILVTAGAVLTNEVIKQGKEIVEEE